MEIGAFERKMSVIDVSFRLHSPFRTWVIMGDGESVDYANAPADLRECMSQLVVEDHETWCKLGPVADVCLTKWYSRWLPSMSDFRSDFASIPHWLWCLVPKRGVYDGPAIMHDALYRFGVLARREADAVFYDAMRNAGVGWFRRTAMWMAVRLAGGSAWRQHRQAGPP